MNPNWQDSTIVEFPLLCEQIFTLTCWRVLLGQNSPFTQEQDTDLPSALSVIRRSLYTTAVNSSRVCFHGFVESYIKPLENQNKNESPYKILKCHTSKKISLSVKKKICAWIPNIY